MANHKSAEKRNRQRIKRRQRNLISLATMRTYMKRFRAAVAGGEIGSAEKALPLAIKAIGKAASQGVIHTNTASRYVSRLTRAFNRAQQS